jgi:16S rRNA C967 or C1407 C5-methylase (RsmB/RsmF family)
LRNVKIDTIFRFFRFSSIFAGAMSVLGQSLRRVAIPCFQPTFDAGKMVPLAFQQQMQTLLGAEYPDFLLALQEPAPVSIRANPLKVRAVEGELFPGASPVPWHPSAFFLPERPVFTLDPLLHAGA